MTGAAVATGVLASPMAESDAAAATVAAPVAQLSDEELLDREARFSRSIDDRRPVADRAKREVLDGDEGRVRSDRVRIDPATLDPRDIARRLMPQFGMSSDEFGCLDNIWSQESGWNIHADNPTSSAYGIPQALPGSKMAAYGDDWASNPVTQIKWGLDYIRDRYGSACGAWGFKASHGWY